MQNKIIPITPPLPSSIVAGTIKGGKDKRWMVETTNGLVNACPAFSCLVAPLAGDSVLIAEHDGHYTILAITERKQAEMALTFPGDVSLNSVSGRVCINSENISLTAGDDLTMLSSQCSTTASKCQFNSGKMQINSHELEARTQVVKWFGKSLDAVIDRVSQHAQNVMRRVEGVETLNVGNLIQTARNTLSTNAKRATISTEKDLKLDGERIHMG